MSPASLKMYYFTVNLDEKKLLGSGNEGLTSISSRRRKEKKIQKGIRLKT